MKQCGNYVIGFAYLKMDGDRPGWSNPELPLSAVSVDEIDRYREQVFRGLKVISLAGVLDCE